MVVLKIRKVWQHCHLHFDKLIFNFFKEKLYVQTKYIFEEINLQKYIDNEKCIVEVQQFEIQGKLFVNFMHGCGKL